MTESRTRSKPAATVAAKDGTAKKVVAKTTAAPKAAAVKATAAKATATKAKATATKAKATATKETPAKAPAAKATGAKTAATKPVATRTAAVKVAAVKTKTAKVAVAEKVVVTKKAPAAKKVITAPTKTTKSSAVELKTPVAKKPATSKKAAVIEKPVSVKPVALKTTTTKAAVAKKKAPASIAPAAEPATAVKKSATVKMAATVKKKKAASPKESMPETAAVPEAAPEAAAEKPSVQGASISFSAVQEPPQHLTLRVDVNRVVAFHYRLRERRPDGSFSLWLEESFGRQPLFYLHGHGNVIAGLEQALHGKKAGDAINITLPPELAYGMRTSNDLMRLPIKHLHGNVNPKTLVPGSIVTMKTNQGLKNALVMKVGKFNVDVDTNHPYAGRTLHYQIEILGVRPASAEEVAHRHVHGPGGHQH